MLKKAIITGVVLTVIVACILNASTIVSFFQGSAYTKVTVVEGQVSAVDFDDKRYTFVKDGKYLFVSSLADMATYTPSEGAVYHWAGIEIKVSEVYQDWFVLLVKPEWK